MERNRYMYGKNVSETGEAPASGAFFCVGVLSGGGQA